VQFVLMGAGIVTSLVGTGLKEKIVDRIGVVVFAIGFVWWVATWL